METAADLQRSTKICYLMLMTPDHPCLKEVHNKSPHCDYSLLTCNKSNTLASLLILANTILGSHSPLETQHRYSLHLCVPESFSILSMGSLIINHWLIFIFSTHVFDIGDLVMHQ